MDTLGFTEAENQRVYQGVAYLVLSIYKNQVLITPRLLRGKTAKRGLPKLAQPPSSKSSKRGLQSCTVKSMLFLSKAAWSSHGKESMALGSHRAVRTI